MTPSTTAQKPVWTQTGDMFAPLAVDMASKPSKQIDAVEHARLAAIRKLPRHKHAPSDVIRFRDPDDPGRGLIGFGISGNKNLRTGFMERAIRALLLTVPKYNAWTGYKSLSEWIKANPYMGRAGVVRFGLREPRRHSGGRMTGHRHALTEHKQRKARERARARIADRIRNRRRR